MFGRCVHWCLHGCGKTVLCRPIYKRNTRKRQVMYVCEECKREYTKDEMLESEGKTKYNGGK